MKNFVRLFCFIYIFTGLQANGQNYLINFAGIGATTTVSSVKVENLTAGTSLTLNGADILHLTLATGVNSIEYNRSTGLKIYPNPMIDYSTLEIFPPVAGNAVITVSDMTGKQVAKIQSHLENLRQAFRLSGIKRVAILLTLMAMIINSQGNWSVMGNPVEQYILIRLIALFKQLMKNL